MINFPLFKKLTVTDFGLYPGLDDNPGLSVDFQPGLTLVLGANGLGKTTFVTILYRMLTGPYDIPILTTRTNLGTANLRPTSLSSAARKVFANRVTDGANGANASLTLSIGDTEISIQRRLRDLALTQFVVDSKSLKLEVGSKSLQRNETQVFQPHITKLTGLWSFGDWILLLRHMVFYFEDRRALVWDPSSPSAPVSVAEHNANSYGCSCSLRLLQESGLKTSAKYWNLTAVCETFAWPFIAKSRR